LSVFMTAKLSSRVRRHVFSKAQVDEVMMSAAFRASVVGLMVLGVWNVCAERRTLAADAKAEELARFAAAGFKAGRAQLKTGVFHATGTKELTHEVPPLKTAVKIYGAFDFEKGSLRFDRDQQIWERVPTEDWKLVPFQGKFALVPDHSLQWTSDDKRTAFIGPPKKRYGIRPFDVRLVGISNWGGLNDTGTDWPVVDRVFAQKVVAGVIEKGSLYHVGWATPNFRFDVWFDSKRDFVPVRYEQIIGAADAKGVWPAPAGIGEAKWTKIEGVWVPSWFKQELKLTKSHYRQELTLERESVNKPVPASLFTWQTLGLPAGTRVVDTRPKEPIKVGIVK
jgi:hypothetical protein